MPSDRKIRWVHWVPMIHLVVCVIALFGYLAPALQFLGILMSVVTIVDMPISLVTIALAFSHHEVFAGIWVTVVGTLWWYLLCRIAEFLAAKIRGTRRVQGGN